MSQQQAEDNSNKNADSTPKLSHKEKIEEMKQTAQAHMKKKLEAEEKKLEPKEETAEERRQKIVDAAEKRNAPISASDKNHVPG